MRTILPAIISASALRAIPTEDTHAVRIILLNSTGSTQYTLRGVGRRKGKYILEKDGASGRHVLDIPVSIWNQDIPQGRYQDNTSIAHDLLAKPQPLIPFVTVIVPWNGAKTIAPAPVAPASSGSTLDLIETLILRLAEARDAATCNSLLTPYLRDAIEREVSPIATEMFTSAGMNEILAFANAMWPPQAAHQVASPAEDNINAPEGSGLEKIPDSAAPKTETPAAKRMREKRARDKAKREANLQPA